MRNLSALEQTYIKERIFFWRDKMGQNKWSVRVRFVTKLDDSRAEVECCSRNGIAVVTVSKQFDDEWTETDLNETTFHEVCEIKYWALRSFLADDVADVLIHEWIRTDENTWFKYITGGAIENT